MAFESELQRGIESLGLRPTPQQFQLLREYLNLLHKWNKAYNLTAIRNPLAMVTYHLLDSLTLAEHLPGKTLSVIDVGTGAGLPGIVLAILFPESRFTLLDSNGKKTRFLMQAKIELGLANVEVVNQRVEAFQPDAAFDIVVSRAFTALDNFARSCAHLCAPGGHFYAMKGRYPEEELQQLPPGFEVLSIVRMQVPGLSDERHLVIFRQVAEL